MSEGASTYHTAHMRFSNLIPVLETDIGGISVFAVVARDLYKGLGVRKDFTDWVKQQIKRLRMIPDRDFRTEPPPPGGTSTYWFTLDIAKHIAMMTNTARGFSVREYFLECERRVLGKSRAEPLQQRAWAERPLDERNSELRNIETIGKYGNHSLAWWYMTEVLHMADFPRHLCPPWQQGNLNLVIDAPKAGETSDDE
jgi:phage anti-repressor protein